MRTRTEELLLSTPPESWRTRQVVVFEWHDGPREGVCELSHPTCSFFFEILAERWHRGSFKERLFRVDEIEMDAVERAIAVLRRVDPPTSPVWAPHGPYESEEEQRRIEDGIAKILSRRTPTRILVQTDDMTKFGDVWVQTHVVLSQ
jgi:hypothetical protein